MELQTVFLPPYAVARIQTHVNRVAPIWNILKGALPTELPCLGKLKFLLLLKGKSSLANS